jgi:cytidylate kinase
MKGAMLQKPALVKSDSDTNDSAPTDTLSLLKAVRLPTKDLPAKLAVVIDGWAESGIVEAGELVAEAIGGVLVDSGVFYHTLTLACMDAIGSVDDPNRTAAFCRDATLDVRSQNKNGLCPQVCVAVNGDWFTKNELKSAFQHTGKVMRVPEVRALVNQALRLCAEKGRVVVIGQDIGTTVLPDSAFKFCLEHPDYDRRPTHSRNLLRPGLSVYGEAYERRISFSEDALRIQTQNLQAREVRGIILLEIFRRALESSSAGNA